MQLGKVREPQGVETTGPGLMQEVKEEKSGEARKESDRKGRRRVSRNRGDSEKLPPAEGNRKATPAPHPPSLCWTLGRAVPTRAPWCMARRSKGAGLHSAHASSDCQPEQAGEAWRQLGAQLGLFRAVPCPAHLATLTRSLTSPRPLCLP